jgi:hypothetical protein
MSTDAVSSSRAGDTFDIHRGALALVPALAGVASAEAFHGCAGGLSVHALHGLQDGGQWPIETQPRQ